MKNNTKKSSVAKALKLNEYISSSHNITNELLARIHEDIKTRDILSSVIISIDDKTVAQLPDAVILGGKTAFDEEIQVWDYEEWRNEESVNLSTDYDRKRFNRSTNIENLRRKVQEHLQYSFVARSYADENTDRVIKYSFVCMCPECRVILGTRQEITKSLEHDFLTGGLNREGLLRELTHKFKERKPNEQFTLLCFNIKNFRVINELHGSAIGDKVLQQTYTSIVYSELNPLSYARYEADNFVLLIRREELDTEVISRLCQLEYKVGNQKISYRLLCGIYHVEEGVSAYSACAHARLATSFIKDQFITPWIVFENRMKQVAISDSEVLTKIEHALSHQEFVVYYQPVVNLQNGKIEMGEALVRWQSKEHGLIMPDKFVPVLERNGGLSRIDQFVEDHVFKTLQQRIQGGKVVVPIDINLSWCDFADAKMIQQLEAHILDTSVPTDLIRFEITETAYEEIADNRKDVLSFFQRNDVKLLVDDFGQGYSFGTVKSTDFFIVKFDKSLIDKLGKSKKMDLLVQSFINVFHTLNCKVVAEGVTDENQLEYLRQSGCDYVQGYYYYKPMDEQSFFRLLEQQEQPQADEPQTAGNPDGEQHGQDELALQISREMLEEPNEALGRMIEESKCMRMLLDELDIHIFEWDVNTHIDVASDRFCQMYGLTSNIIPQMPEVCPLVLEEDRDRFRSFYGRIARGEKLGSDCFRLYHPDGKNYTWFRKTFYTLFDKNGLPYKAIITMQDCQDEYRFRMLRTRDRMLTIQQEIVTFAYTVCDDKLQLNFRTPKGEVQTNTMSNFLGGDPSGYIEDQRMIADNLRRIIAENSRSGHFDFTFSPTKLEFRAHYAMVDGEYGNLYAIIGQAEDINKTRERLDAKERLIRLSELDGLTQIYNRSTGERLIINALKRHQPGVFGVLDCDKFKSVNDTFGHVVGDALLAAVARAMKECHPDGINIRLGGDEFAFCLLGEYSHQRIEELVNIFFDKINHLEVPGMSNFPISVSVGAVIFSGKEDDNFDNLYRQADLLLYRSKEYLGNKLTL